MRCIGCGELLNAGQAVCPTCSLPAVGSAFSEDVLLPLDASILPPLACCCCMGPSDLLRKEKITVGGASVKDGAFQQEYIRVPVPWCRTCSNRRTHLFVATLTAFITASIAAIYGIALLRHGDMSAQLAMIGIAIGGLAAGLFRSGLKAVLPGRPGHVAHCLALSGGIVQRSQKTGRDTIILTFRNRAFARFWTSGLVGGRVVAMRERLLADCDTLHQRALARQDSNPSAGRGIREGISAARGVIAQTVAGGDDLAGYAKALREGLEKERERLSRDSSDDDGWNLGGLRSVANHIDELVKDR